MYIFINFYKSVHIVRDLLILILLAITFTNLVVYGPKIDVKLIT